MSDEPKYPWQKLVLDALSEPLSERIEIAEAAIAARLKTQPQPGVDEELALRNALNTLRVLAPEATPKTARKRAKKKGAA